MMVRNDVSWGAMVGYAKNDCFGEGGCEGVLFISVFM